MLLDDIAFMREALGLAKASRRPVALVCTSGSAAANFFPAVVEASSARVPLILAGGRSETIRGLRGDGRDERFRQIDVAATAIAGLVVITAVIVGFLVEVARGHDGSPYAQLGALGGVAYLVAVAVLRVRG
jgi:hypothetical protein